MKAAKKIMALVLAVTMLACVGVGALAAGGTTCYDITINGTKYDGPLYNSDGVLWLDINIDITSDIPNEQRVIYIYHDEATGNYYIEQNGSRLWYERDDENHTFTPIADPTSSQASDDTIGSSGSTGAVPVTVTAEAAVFSVTVPASLPLTINADGTVSAPTNLEITNNSAGPVRVSGVTFQPGSQWGLAAFDSGFDSMKVDAHKLGLKLTAGGTSFATTDAAGAQSNDVNSADWRIVNGTPLSITAAGAASAVSTAVNEASAASVIFTVTWDTAA